MTGAKVLCWPEFLRRASPPAAVPEGLRVYAIGDVHGRLDLLQQLLDLVRRDAVARGPVDRCEVVLLGDLIDRGPDSAGVVDLAMRPIDWATLHVLMGNHEAALLDVLDGDREVLRSWLRIGGKASLRSWGVDPSLVEAGSGDEIIAALRIAIAPAQRAWLARRPVSLRRGNYLLVHAGIRPGIALDRQSRHDMLWIRDDFLASARDHGVTVVHGHAVTETVDERRNRIGIDTGAWRSNRLTALGLEGTSRWQLET